MQIFIFESSTIKPVSLNAAFATLKNGRRVRSKAYAKFASQMMYALRPLRPQITEFKAHFNPLIHDIHARLEMGMPDLYCKTGAISLKSGDVANYEKTITDCITLGVLDDAYITHWQMTKFKAEESFFRFTLEIVNRVM